MPVSIRVDLEEDCSGRVLRSVGGYSEGGGQVGEMENRFQEK